MRLGMGGDLLAARLSSCAAGGDRLVDVTVGEGEVGES
ncbi:hypothetical protein SBD_1647 [Streptomyces bottropensis ATCC 25435]|uniref:Uncharacterized protein n=1 Tax=Streptomyces bottropensis ATCC 25435 TaxID=1054862 RepID=M3EL11_9ACTN|nr:hypothetical protein SBD_1647 [Streptomyces bottropensis ATCC 25435]